MFRVRLPFLRANRRGGAVERGSAPASAAELIPASALEALQVGTDAVQLLVRTALLDGVQFGREHAEDDVPDAVLAEAAEELAAKVPLMLGHALAAPVLVRRRGSLADLLREMVV